MECAPVFHYLFPQSHLQIYEQSPEEEEERRECTGARDICPAQAEAHGLRGAMKVREKKGGGGSEARSMPEEKLLRSWRSHSKPGNHTTLIPNFETSSFPSWAPGSCFHESSFLSLHSFLSVFLCRQWQDGEDLETGSGQEGRGRWWGGGWAGSQSLKISQTAETQGWPTEVRRHTFNFSYFCCFFHNIRSLPYKPMT